MRNLVLALSLAAFAYPRPAVASLPRTGWTPTGKWEVNFEDNQCSAVRAYANGDRQLRLGFESRPTTNVVRVMIEVPGHAGIPAAAITKILFGGKPREKTSIVKSFPSARPNHAIFYFKLLRDDIAELEKAGSVGIEASQVAVDVPVGSLGPLMDVMDVCISDLLTSWGFAPADQRRLATQPRPRKPHLVLLQRQGLSAIGAQPGWRG